MSDGVKMVAKEGTTAMKKERVWTARSGEGAIILEIRHEATVRSCDATTIVNSARKLQRDTTRNWKARA
jgi:hypothetical protein